MLKLEYLFENFDLAKECLALYDADEASLNKCHAHFRISSNAVYPFVTAAKPRKLCFLRLSPPAEKDYLDVVWEIEWIRWLLEKGYPAMKPHAMCDGRLSAQIATRWGTYNVSCFEAVEGDTLEDADGSVSIAKGYGRTLGQLHHLTKDYLFAGKRRDHKALLLEISGRLTSLHAPDCILAEFEQVCTELAALPVQPDCYGVVHYDFEPDNVLYDEDTGRFGVIDFDDAIRCWYSLDVVRALDGMDDVVKKQDVDEARSAFLAGYREEMPFTDEQEVTLPLMRRLVRLQSYATILHVLASNVPCEPDWLTELVEKLTGMLRSIEADVTGMQQAI